MTATAIVATVARYGAALVIGIAWGSAHHLDNASPAQRSASAEPVEHLQHALHTVRQTDRAHAQALRDAKQACRDARGENAVMFETPDGHLVCRLWKPAS